MTIQCLAAGIVGVRKYLVYFAYRDRIARRDIGALVFEQQGGGRERGFPAGHDGQRIDFDVDQFERVLGKLRGLGNDHGDRFAHVANLVARDRPLQETIDAFEGCKSQRDDWQRVEIGPGKGGDDAGLGLGRRKIDPHDTAMRDRTAQHREIDHAVERDIVDVGGFATQQTIVLEPLQRLTGKGVHDCDSLRRLRRPRAPP